MSRWQTALLSCLVLLGGLTASASGRAVKSNLLSDALYNINLGIEAAFAPKWTVQLVGDYNAWNLSHQRLWKHWLIQPEVRYWLSDAFRGHFFGAHAIAGQYNFGHLKNGIRFLGTDLSKLSDRRYQGWGAGLGVAYGYTWRLSEHWNIEAEIGIGWIYTRFDVFKCEGCGPQIQGNRVHNYVGPTKGALTVGYVF